MSHSSSSSQTHSSPSDARVPSKEPMTNAELAAVVKETIAQRDKAMQAHQEERQRLEEELELAKQSLRAWEVLRTNQPSSSGATSAPLLPPGIPVPAVPPTARQKSKRRRRRASSQGAEPHTRPALKEEVKQEEGKVKTKRRRHKTPKGAEHPHTRPPPQRPLRGRVEAPSGQKSPSGSPHRSRSRSRRDSPVQGDDSRPGSETPSGQHRSRSRRAKSCPQGWPPSPPLSPSHHSPKSPQTILKERWAEGKERVDPMPYWAYKEWADQINAGVDTQFSWDPDRLEMYPTELDLEAMLEEEETGDPETARPKKKMSAAAFKRYQAWLLNKRHQKSLENAKKTLDAYPLAKEASGRATGGGSKGTGSNTVQLGKKDSGSKGSGNAGLTGGKQPKLQAVGSKASGSNTVQLLHAQMKSSGAKDTGTMEEQPLLKGKSSPGSGSNSVPLGLSPLWEQASPKEEAAEPPGAKPKDQRGRVPCRFHRFGKCIRGAQCPYLHEGIHNMPQNQIPCQYLKKGKCRKGAACPWMH